MTIGHGLGMLAVGIVVIVIGSIIAWYIINKVKENDDT
jgi:hypothetical protein